MHEFQVIVHVQGEENVITATPSPSGGYEITGRGIAESARNFKEAVREAVEAARRFFHRQLSKPQHQSWGVRIMTRCGNFQFGDWSSGRPLSGSGGPAPQGPIFDLFEELRDRSNRQPESALESARKLLEFCGRG
jgi:hypothetical protein